MLKVINGGITPTRGSKYSAMVDLYAREDVVIGAGCTSIVNLGVKIDWKEIMKICASCDPFVSADDDIKEYEKFMASHYLELHPRSSLRAKGLIIGVGICDLDYPDELGLIVHNPLNSIIIDAESNIVHLGACNLENICEYTIKKGDKIAQCTLKEHKGWLLGIESDAVRSGGFGSTGM